jgi:carbamoyl-phosphate synthase large subunit
MFRNKKVFISGAAGVIGNEMVDILLEQGAQLFVGDLKSCPEKWFNKLFYKQGDLNELTFEEINHFQPEYFIHLAATFERSTETYEFWSENFRHNIQLSNHLMTLIKEVKSIQSVVYASSYLIYDPHLYNFTTAQEQPYSLKESDSIYPRNLTGMAKLAHEIELRFIELFKSEQFTISTPRIYRGYGRNSRDIISRWVRALIKNEEINIYRPEGIFDYLYAKDSAEGLLHIAKNKVKGIVNLGTGKARKVEEVIAVLKQHFPNLKANYINNNIPFEASQADITLLKKSTGWEPKYTIEKGIKEIISFEKSRIEIPKINYGNILISSASKKIGLVKAVQEAAKNISETIKVYAGDLNQNALSKNFADEFYSMPKTVEENKSTLLNWFKENNIRCVIPSRDGELHFWAKWKNELLKYGISVMVSDEKSVENCLDKFTFSSYCINSNIPAIASFLNIEEVNSEFLVVKERFGAGALSIALNIDKEKAKVHAKKLENPIFQPYSLGKEISVDAYISQSGKVKGLITRYRKIIENGESVVTQTFYSEKLSNEIIEYIEKLNLYGHIILQLFIDQNDNLNIIECNTRFGGASTLSIKAGLNSFYWFILEAHGVSVENFPFQPLEQILTQIRYPQDLIIYGDHI